MPTQPNGTVPIRRLSRVQQLTLNTWRLATAKLERVLDSGAVLEHAALHAVIGVLRDVEEPMTLFARHALAHEELALVNSLVTDSSPANLTYDILDTAFLLRWNELVANGAGPEEVPPLRPRPGSADGPRSAANTAFDTTQ